ncbi:hypothetical protein Slala05_82150 [Streptomyces lavendulae subsp. lavendulae]|nr:hypothetical protein Slala05_82150 [Streptomyces lavendulae subsp. lavendulae]
MPRSPGWGRGPAGDVQGEDFHNPDIDNRRIRRVTVDASSTPIETVIRAVAGNGADRWRCGRNARQRHDALRPVDAGTDTEGNVCVVDRCDHRVRRLTRTSSPTRISVRPGRAGDLVINGAKGNPGVLVENVGGGAVPPRAVRVTLPSSGVPGPLPEGVPRYVLTAATTLMTGWQASHSAIPLWAVASFAAAARATARMPRCPHSRTLPFPCPAYRPDQHGRGEDNDFDRPAVPRSRTPDDACDLRAWSHRGGTPSTPSADASTTACPSPFRVAANGVNAPDRARPVQRTRLGQLERP